MSPSNTKKNKIIFGMPTLIEKPEITECLALCGELGLDFVELNMNLPHYQPHKLDADKVLKLLSGKDIFLTIHLDENLNVCDFNESVARAYLDTTLRTIAFAKKLNIPVINMHLATGVYFTLPDEKVYLFNEYKSHYLERLRNFREVCSDAVASSNIKLCIENCKGFKGFLEEGVQLLLESDVFSLTWDIGHDHGNGNVDTGFMLQNADRVAHMHIHDALGKQNHLILGTGEINLAERLDFAEKHQCRCVLETKTVDGLQRSVSFLKEHGYLKSED